MLSLYVGGMGSREQNFYNRLVSTYGFEAAAKEVQDLYLAGRKSEAAMALPDALIDAVSIVGPAGPGARKGSERSKTRASTR